MSAVGELGRNATRKRKFATKTPGRCHTCSLRHVRCSQERPICTTCIRSGRQCTYLSDPMGTNLKIVSWKVQGSTQIGRSPLMPTCQSLGDARSMQYFRMVVCSGLGGSFIDPFWGRITCQVAQSVAPVRNAMIALSLLWEQSFSNRGKESDVKGQLTTLALKRYATAVSETRALLEQDKRNLSMIDLLICNLLFVCFECLQQHHESALGQISSGLYLFHSWRSSQTKSRSAIAVDEVERQLVKTYRRLTTQSTLFFDTHLFDRRVFDPAVVPSLPTVPNTFTSIEEARDCFMDLVGVIIQQSISERSPNLQKFEQDTSRTRPVFRLDSQAMDQYFKAFKTFKAHSSSGLDERQSQALAALEMMQLTISILQRAGIEQNEAAFDRYQPDFETIISICSSMLDLNVPPQRRYSFDIELIPPLYFVACRCRHPATRRQALRLLGLVRHREGTWDSKMVAALAQHIIKDEEAGLGEVQSYQDIPAWKRLTLTKAVIDSADRVISVCFSRPHLCNPICHKIRY